MKNKLTLLLTICISAIAFAQEDWKIFEKDNYSIQYPATWEYSDQKPQPTIQFVLMSEEASQNEDMFRENINLNTESLKGQDISLKDYAKAGLDQIFAQIPSAKIISNKNIKLGAKNAKEIIWSANLGNGMLLRFKQVFLLNDGIAYVLTFSATETDYDKYIEDGEKIISSFKFTN